MELNDYLKLPYTITLRIEDDGGWVARIQELPGCTADGATQAGALVELEQAKREWIQAALEDEVPIPRPESDEHLPSGKWVQRVPRSLHKNLTRRAKLEGISLNHLVTSILSEDVGAKKNIVSTKITKAAVAYFDAGGRLTAVAATAQSVTIGTTASGSMSMVSGSPTNISAVNDQLTERV